MAKYLDENGLATQISIEKATFISKSDVQEVEVDSSPTANSTNLVTSGGVKTAVDSKQDTISDLATIRSGAALGATALQSYTETDPTVPSWAKASTKPSYTAVEVGAQPTLVSGTNIKTVNNESLLGSGNITINADTSACELLANKVTSLSSSSTDVQYPSAKAVWDTFYQKPLTGIPETDLDEAVKEGLVYIATKGTTPVADIEAAFDAGKYIILISGITRMRLEYGNSSSIAFDCLSWSGSTLKKFRTTLNRSTGVFSDTASNIQATSGRTSSWTATPNNDRYPSEKLVKDSLDLKEDTANKVTSLSSSSTDTQYPSALCVYNLIGDIETLINAL